MKLLIQTIPLVSAIAFVSFVLPITAQAHGEAGMTFSATSTTESGKQYLVDIDYGELYIEAGRFGRFDFNLFSDAERTKPASYTDLWVRIVQEDGSRVGNTLFAGPIAKVQFGAQGFAFAFPEGGQYTMSVRYNDTSKDTWGETVAEAEFPLNVLRSEDQNTLKLTSAEFWVGLIAGLFVAVIGLLPIVMRRKKH